MTYPIEVPPELFAEWWAEGVKQHGIGKAVLAAGFVARKAAEWGAAAPLEKCCEAIVNQIITIDNIGLSGPAGVLHTDGFSSWPAFALMVSNQLRAAMRPKPPSLKEQALAELEALLADLNTYGFGFTPSVIRRALETLPSES